MDNFRVGSKSGWLEINLDLTNFWEQPSLHQASGLGLGWSAGSMAGVRYVQCEPLKGVFTRPSTLTGKVQAEDEANSLRWLMLPERLHLCTVHLCSQHYGLLPRPTWNNPQKYSWPTAKKPSATLQISNLTKPASESICSFSEHGQSRKCHIYISLQHLSKLIYIIICNIFYAYNYKHSPLLR